MLSPMKVLSGLTVIVAVVLVYSDLARPLRCHGKQDRQRDNVTSQSVSQSVLPSLSSSSSHLQHHNV